MKITWVTRSFLDYRLPIYEEINRLCNKELTVIYFADVVPVRCQERLKEILGDRAIGLTGEVRLGGKKTENQSFANSGGLRIPLRPGLVKKIKSTKPDIILSDGFFQWTYAALINNAIWKTPHIMCYERTMHTERNVSTVRKLARKIAARFIDAICSNGIQTEKYLVNFGFPREKIYIGNMAADNDGLQLSISNLQEVDVSLLKKRYDITEPIFLYVGQLIPRKGIMELLTAWNKFSLSNPLATLVIIGDGDEKEKAEDFVRNSDIGSIKLLGKMDYSEIPIFYAAADIFVMPTLEDNWSLVVPEAMSCGLPILCSQYNGCWPELVKPQNGWIFNPLDKTDFEQALKTAWNEYQRWAEMGEASINIVQEYSPEKMAGKIFEACEDTLNGK